MRSNHRTHHHHDHHRGGHGRPEGEEGFVRMRHGGPFGGPGRGGPFGFGPGGPGPFGPGGPRGRGRKRRGDVRIALLLLLGEEPRNGYQLMQTLEERSDGRWRPSPGSVYPALSQLEDEGFVRSIQSDSGRTFEITDAGREHLAERGDQKAPWEDDSEDGESYRDVRHIIGSTVKAAAQVVQDGSPEQVAKAIEILNETRRALYRLLAEEPEA
jgi:DNA-binding PadR family transcriptional regulator